MAKATASSEHIVSWAHRHPWRLLLIGIVLGAVVSYASTAVTVATGAEPQKVGTAVRKYGRGLFNRDDAGSASKKPGGTKTNNPYSGGWGPNRKVIRPQRGEVSKAAAFNSLMYRGWDQRDFVGCRWVGSKTKETWNDLNTASDGTVVVRTYIENASSKKAIRDGRMFVSLVPQKGSVGVTLEGAKPVLTVWDGCRVWSDAGRPEMRIVPGSGVFERYDTRTKKYRTGVHIGDAVLKGENPLPAQTAAAGRGVIPGSPGPFGVVEFQVLYTYPSKT